MHNARIYCLYEHVATVTSVKNSLLRGDTVIVMADREKVPERVRTLGDGIVYVDPTKKGYFKKVKELCKNCDYIILQSLAEDYTFAFNMLRNPKMLKKSVWVIAGGDLYSWKRPVKGGTMRKLEAKVRNAIAGNYRKKIKYVVCTSLDEYRYKKDFGTAVVYAKQSNNPGYTCADIENLKPEIRPDKPFTVMVGHSSTKDLNHLEVIESLKSVTLPENTRYLFPLNYGSKDYGDKVETAAKAAFGDKAEVLRDRLPFDEYVKKLWEVDCAVFHTDRQIAFGNLLMLLYMKKKLFVKKGTVMWDYLCDRGVPVFDSGNITAEALNCTTVDLQPCRELAFKVNDSEAGLNEWKNILADLEKRIGENRK